MRSRLLPLVIAGIALASGCSGGANPQPMITPTPVASAHASATPTANPSTTPTGSTPTATPHATATPTATPTPSATPSATPTPSPVPTFSGAPTTTGLYVEAAFPNSIVQVTTTLTVPAEPPATGTVILWPGLVPVNSNGNTTFSPVDAGILRPVLTWGPSCAPGTQPTAYSTWWISGEYYNGQTNDSNFAGCRGGSIMSVDVGDQLTETLTLNGTVWTEQVSDAQTNRQVSFVIDMQGQTQNSLYFFIDGYGQNPVATVSFANTSFTVANALGSANACQLATAGSFDPNDAWSTPTLSGNGLTCSIATITLASPFADVPSALGRRALVIPRFGLP